MTTMNMQINIPINLIINIEANNEGIPYVDRYLNTITDIIGLDIPHVQTSIILSAS
jgi:hypothetical protein